MTIQKVYDDGKKHIHVLSFGAGTQSSALLLMALRGEINGVIPDFIIFADTGWEPQYVYEWIDKLNRYINHNFKKEIIITKGRNIRNDIIDADTGRNNKFIGIPAFIKRADGKIGMGKRQCTREYKISPINRKIRELLGYEPKKRVKEIVHIWKGISIDEIQRVKPARVSWQVAEHPLIDVVNIDRVGCIRYVEASGLGTPVKSSCIGCPYHNDALWREMKTYDPVSWNDAVLVDKELRKNKTSLRGEVFLHRSCKPLDEITFNAPESNIDNFINECEGICGV